MRSQLAAWYRRYYLLINVPALFLLTELAMARIDPVNVTHSSNLDMAFARYNASPPQGAPILLLVGNSAVRAGLDQEMIESASAGHAGLRVYNFGLNTARISDELGLLQLLHDKGIQPRAVVLGFNLYSIANDDSDTRYPWHHRGSPYVFFHRHYLGTAVQERLKRFLAGERKRPYSQFEQAPASESEEFAMLVKFISAFDGRVDGDFPELNKISQLIERWREHGVRVHVVLLPMSPRAFGFTSFYSLYDAMRARLPADTLDLTMSFPVSAFRDVGHVNAVGRQKLTAEIIAWLATKREI